MTAYYLVYYDGYHCFNQKGELHAIKDSENKAKAWVEQWNKYCLPNPNTLAPTTCTSDTVPCQKGNNPMFIDDCRPYNAKKNYSTTPAALGAFAISVSSDATPPVEVEQRDYLLSRASNIRYSKNAELNEKFYIYEPQGPKTTQELEDRLKAGLYTIRKPEKDDLDDDFYWRDYFSWRTPDTQADQEGYDAAWKEFNSFYTSVIDQIKILDPKEGLAAIKTLEDWKPSSPGIVAKLLG